MTSQRLRTLFDALTQRPLSPDETQELSALWEDPSQETLAKELLEQWYDRVPLLFRQTPEDAESMFRAVVGKEEENPLENEQPVGKLRSMRTIWWAAAVVLALLAGGGYLVLRNNEIPQGQDIVKTAPVAPGREGAILTLADGSTVLLDTLSDGTISTQSGTAVRLAGGKLSYEAGADAVPVFNTISTPRGRFFRLILPDGSRVWLNAASSIQYPTAFSGTERRVEVKGEAYFEVAHDAGKPFKVALDGGAEVEVLGTHFNVNDYGDEPAPAVTLLEGSVRVKNKSNAVVLEPGQQAVLEHSFRVQREVNTAQVVAWKDGGFNFDNMGVETVMRQLSRWYDIEVVYQHGIPDKKFYGEIGRELTLEEVLEGLKLSGVHFRIEAGKKLIVLP